MKQTFTTVVALLCCLASWAQWAKPEAPAVQPLPVDGQAYLYNADADAFWLGANDWKTRASVSESRGYKVTLAKHSLEGEAWDGESYKIMTAIEDGDWKGMTLPTFLTDWNAIWVDAKDDNTDDKGWTFTQEADGTYTIGLSKVNSRFTPNDEYGEYEGAYLGVNTNGYDTRVYLCTKYELENNAAVTYHKRWYFVSEADYTAYIAAKKQYEAALPLGADIEMAKEVFADVDISSVEAVYNNTSSTAEQLIEARRALKNMLMPLATPSLPVDVTFNYVTNPSYDDNNNDGWKGSAPGFQQYRNAEFYDCNYNYNQALKVPAGVYVVSVEGFYRAGSAEHDAELSCMELEPDGLNGRLGQLFATTKAIGQRTTSLPLASEGATGESLAEGTVENKIGFIPNNMYSAAVYTEAGRYPATQVLTMVGEDGELTIGLLKEMKYGGDWTIFDNWKLSYLGNGNVAYDFVRNSLLGTHTNYEYLVNGGILEYYCHADYEAYSSALATLKAAATGDEIAAALASFLKAENTFAESLKAYENFTAKFNEINDYLGEHGADLMGDGVELCYEYMEGDKGPGIDNPLFPNGGALYILENGTLSAEAIAAELAFMQSIFDEALASGMQDGQDCTELIKNRHFNEAGVWNKEGLPEWPKGTDSYKLAEAYSILFNVNQTLTGLQNGLYELSLSDFYRPANYGGEGYNTFRAYVYMNDDEAQLNHIESGATDEAAGENDYYLEGRYVPNTVEDAAKAFEDGRYRQTLFGLVTDGTMKIGVRNDVRFEGCWALWSDFKLTFRAKNPEALASVLSSSLPNAEAKLDSKCGNEELDALRNTIEVSKGNPEDGYQALVNLKNAMAAVDACTENYVQLFTALKSADATFAEHADDTSAELDALKALFDKAYAAYEAGTYNNQAAIDMAAAINSAIVAVMMGGGESAEEKDVSDLIVNNDFDPSRGSKDNGTIEGWTTSPMNGYKQNTVSYNRAAIDLKQTLNGLPAGHYRVTVHTYYRAGYYDEEWTRKENGEETHLTTLYATTPAKTYETKVMNLYEGAVDALWDDFSGNTYTLANGKFAPDGTGPTAQFFAADHYLNTLEFDVTEDGADVTIGLKKSEILANDYEVVGKWNLYYTPVAQAKDVSDLIVNNDFDPSRGSKDNGTIEGWTTSPMNGYKQNTVSYNRAAIDLKQTLNGLPAGHYRVTVHTYYRAGYYDEEWTRKENGEETHLTTLYAETPAKTYETKVMNLYEDAQPEAVNGSKCYTLPNGLFAPDGTSPTAEFFNAGFYLNSLEFDVPEDGTDVTIGLKKTEILANDYEVVGKWNLYYTPAASAKDVSDLIVNNDFDPSRGSKDNGTIEGWTTSPMNGYKQNTVSYNRAAIDLKQTLNGLPAGDYKVTVHTYYRAGYYDEEWTRKENGEETHLTTLYAETPDQTYETKVMNLYEDAQPEAVNGSKCYTLPNGLFAPDGTSPTAEFFNAGHYLNELQFTVLEDGSNVTIGLKKDEILANDYEVVGKWNLYYYGKGSNTGIEDVTESPVSSVASGIYSLDGLRLSAPQRGVNIVKTPDGRTLKLYVK